MTLASSGRYRRRNGQPSIVRPMLRGDPGLADVQARWDASMRLFGWRQPAATGPRAVEFLGAEGVRDDEEASRVRL
jgi:hypothetical protein